MTRRTVFAAIFLVCAALLAVALYMQYMMGLEPCPLCWLQRFAFMGAGLVGLLGWVHGPGRVATRLYGVLLALVSGAGLGMASRQLWLQSLPADQVPACGPSVDYMLEVLPFTEVLATALRGTGDCAVVVWRFMGLSIPGWSAVFFVCVLLTGLYLCLRPASGRGR